jgi:hypothetical protein
MNHNYYKEACMCRHPVPSRIIPHRCAWCGGILPPSVRAMYAIQQEMDGIPSGGAILAVVLVALAMLIMIAIGRITLIASQHEPTPPAFSTHYEREEVRPR